MVADDLVRKWHQAISSHHTNTIVTSVRRTYYITYLMHYCNQTYVLGRSVGGNLLISFAMPPPESISLYEKKSQLHTIALLFGIKFDPGPIMSTYHIGMSFVFKDWFLTCKLTKCLSTAFKDYVYIYGEFVLLKWNTKHHWPMLLTWCNFNPSMDK